MKIIYDKEVDALSIIFQETAVTTQHLAEEIAVFAIIAVTLDR